MEYVAEALALKAYDRRIPFDVTLELTRRCNQSCTMCYQPPGDNAEMDTATVAAVLRKLAAAQCLFLTFTGGEILLRADALDLIDLATDLGFAVTVKTNGTLLDDAGARRLAQCSVMEAHVSLLGGSAPSHDAVTGMEGSFAAVRLAVGELHCHGVTVAVMAVITRGKVDEMDSIRRLVRSWGIDRVNFSAVVFPRSPGDASVGRYRLTDDELRRFYATLRALDNPGGDDGPCRVKTEDPRLLSCTALQDGFTITPDGTVIPCSALPVPLGNIVSDSLDAILFSGRAESIIESLQLTATPECTSCIDRIGCIRCPGLAYMDNGMAATVPREACRHTAAFKATTAAL
jgi:radical SAM protein with 4Fe4S-binding SPASM domain